MNNDEPDRFKDWTVEDYEKEIRRVEASRRHLENVIPKLNRLIRQKELRKSIAEMNRHIEHLKDFNWQADDLADARKHRDTLVKALVELTEDREFSSI